MNERDERIERVRGEIEAGTYGECEPFKIAKVVRRIGDLFGLFPTDCDHQPLVALGPDSTDQLDYEHLLPKASFTVPVRYRYIGKMPIREFPDPPSPPGSSPSKGGGGSSPENE